MSEGILKKVSPHNATHKWGMFLICLSAFFYCYEYLLRIAPSVMIDLWKVDFPLDVDAIGIISAFYYFAYAPLQAVVGVIIDAYGPKRVLTLSVVCCVAGCLFMAAAHHLAVMYLGRALIGVGSAFAYVGSLALARKYLSSTFFSFFAGVVTSLGMLGALVGNIGVAKLLDHVDGHWRLVMGLFAMLGFIIYVLFVVAPKETKVDQTSRSRSFRAARQNWINIARIKEFWLVGMIGSLLYTSLSVFAEMWGPSFIHVAWHVDQATGAEVSGMVFLGWFFGAPCQAWFYNRCKSFRIVFTAQSFLALVAVIIAIFYVDGSHFWVEACFFLYGFFSSVEVLCFTYAVRCVRPQVSATAIAFINFFIMLSGLILQPLIGTLLKRVWHGALQGGVRVYTLIDYQYALVVLPAALFVVVVMSLCLNDESIKKYRKKS